MKYISLDDTVHNLIHRYPTLYRTDNYESSRLRALDHILLGYGTGYVWDQGGFLFNTSDKIKKIKLPDDYFSKNLYSLNTTTDRLSKAVELLGDVYHYVYECTVMKQEARIVFESKDHDSAQLLFKQFNELCGNNQFVRVRTANASSPHIPHNVCKYSPICEILEGQTSSLEFESFPLTPHPEWLQGAVDVVRHSLGFYQDKELCKKHFYHYDRIYADFKRDRKSNKKPTWVDNKFPEKTDLQYAERIWNDFYKVEIAFLQKFMEKFG